MRVVAFIFFTLFPFVGLMAETVIQGKVYDSESKPINGIIVRLYEKEKLKSYSSSRNDGSFTIKTDTIEFPAKLVFMSRYYSQKELIINEVSDSVAVVLYPEEYELDEVVVRVPHTRVRGDTIIYDVASFTNNGDRSIEDVLKKLPGVNVEDNGTITYEGETINNFYIEGLNLMGNNYAVATRSIRPSDIVSVSVYERHQPKKVLKDVADSKKAALNLKLKKDIMLKPVGYLKGGAGVGDDFLWLGELYGMFISPNNQTIISGKGNNTGNCYKQFRHADDVASGVFIQDPFGRPAIPQNRYVANSSAYFTANTLFRPKNDLTVTLNSSYSIEDNNYQGFSSTTYLIPDSISMMYSEGVNNSLNNHVVEVGAKVERNIDNFYFSDKFSFQGRFTNNDYDIENSSAVNQFLKADSYSFSNNLSVILKNDEKMYEISSETFFINSPLNKMWAYDSKSEPIVAQKVNGRSFYNKEKTAFSWKLSPRNIIGVNLAFEAATNAFCSRGYKAGPTCSDNDLSGYNIVATVAPTYKFMKPGKFSWEISFPVCLRNLKYKDLISDNVSKLSDVYVDLISSIFYKVNQFQHFDVSFGCKHTSGDIKDFISNPVFTTFRNSVVYGNGDINEIFSNYASASYFFRSPIEGFYANASLSYNFKKSNYLSEYNVASGGTETSSVEHKNHSSFTNFMFTLTKDIRKWNTSISLNGNGIFMSGLSRRSSTDIKVKNNVYMLTGRVESHLFDDILSGNINFTYSSNHQSFDNVIASSDFDELSMNGKVSVYPFEKFEVWGSLFFNRSKVGEDKYVSNVFIDAGARYSFDKIELEFIAQNLLNTQEYGYSIYRSLDIISYSYRLRPLGFALNVRYKF